MVPTLQFAEVSKRYRLGAFQGGLRAAVPGFLGGLRRDGRSPREELWALRDISFALAPGRAMGIIGPNGAGKTTLLKLATNVTYPTAGRIELSGRMAALIQLGAGFHPDLTGRENVFLNGTILGMRRREVAQRFDAIVDFSGLERFLDTPVKRYSSGMYCRLGFAVAAFVNPELLVIDEVLAVGDKAFQVKGLNRMAELKAQGTAILFVTHDLGYVHRLCDEAIFLHRGEVQAGGRVEDVIRAYRGHPAYLTGGLGGSEEAPIGRGPAAGEPPAGTVATPIVLRDVHYTRADGAPVTTAEPGAILDVHVVYEALRPVADVTVELWIYGLDGIEYASFATGWDGIPPLALDGPGEIVLRLDGVSLMPGAYFVNAAVADRQGLHNYDVHWERHQLVVSDGPVSHGVLYQPHSWRLGAGTESAESN
jgi:ABC-type polysaccharide/polyol phosphate transport system ATPase subunit